MKEFYSEHFGKINFQKCTRFIFGVIFLLGFIPFSALSQTINVTTTNDVVNAGDGVISLREAIIDANAAGAGSTVTINLPAGTYALTLAGNENAAATGDLDVNHTVAGTKTINIVGAGAAGTIITGTMGERAFDVHSLTAPGAFLNFSVTGVTFSNINAAGSGAAILAGREGDNTTITSCIFSGNTAATIGGAISQSSSNFSHNLTITNSTFTNNTATTATGGAINYNGLGGTVSITGCTFSGNTAGTMGGAIQISGSGTGPAGPLTTNILKNNFINNTANGNAFGGAAVGIVNAQTININFNRIIGNLAPNVAGGKVISTGGGNVGTMNTDNNWWGVNSGPSGSDILGTAAASWLQLKASATTSTLCPAGSTLVTAGFLSNSAGAAVSASDLGAVTGLSVVFTAALGNLTGAQTTIQSTGTATVTFNATGNGAGSVNAVVDNVPNTDATAKATISITAPVISSVDKTDPTCADPNGGEIVVNATGTATLEYSINGGTDWFTTNTFSGLTAGNYTVWVRSTSNPSCVTVYNSNPVELTAATGCKTLTLTAEGPSGTVCGENVTVTIKVKDFTDMGTLDFSVNWDNTKLQYVSHTAPDIDGSAPVTGPAGPITNALTFTWFDAGVDYGSTLADGTIILTLNFTVLSNSATGITVDITGTPTALNASDLNFEEVTVTPENLVSFDVQKVVVSDPAVTQPTCPTPSGTIVVNATGPGTLEYSVNNGTDWFLSNSFSGLAPGTYNIKARLQSSPTCEAAYSGNPVVLNAATGCCVPPDISDPTVTQPNCTISTGTIVVNATGTGTLEYSINNGADWFSTNTFENLAPGSYNIRVRLQSSPTCFSAYSGNPVVLSAATNCCTLTCPDNITVNNDAGVCGAYVTYPAASATPGCGAVSYSKASGSLFPIGTTTVTVNTASGQSCSFTVTVNDTEAPVITTKSSPTIILWSPEHKYQTITVAQIVTGVTDNCGSIPVSSVRITKVTSDEAENAPGNGDGNTTNDIRIKSNCKSVDLRRERNGTENGRVYTIHLSVTDAKSNTGTATYKVYVPHNQSGNNAIDDGAVYTVNSGCGSNTRTMEAVAPALPDGFALEQNIPNPFSSATVIRYAVPEEMRVSLAVYNNTGQKVAQLVDARVTAGYHQVRFESSKLAAGIYLYRMESVGSDGKRIVVTKKMIIAN